MKLLNQRPCFVMLLSWTSTQHLDTIFEIIYHWRVLMKWDLFNLPQATLSGSANTPEATVGNNMRIVFRAVWDKHEALFMACRRSAIQCHLKAALLFKCQNQSRETGEKMQAEISTCFSCHPAHNVSHKNTSLPFKKQKQNKTKK